MFAVVDTEKRVVMGNRIFVGNLSFGVTTEALRATFEEIGEVSDVHVVTDRETGRPRGFGFVTMASAEDAAKAIATLNGTIMDGRPLNVNEAQERGQGGGQRRGGFGGGGPPKHRGGGQRNRW
jgi:RNA recognition motif-containing protein